MREILFRGKSRDTNKWVFGDFVSDACGISREEYLNEYGDIGHIMTYVLPETVGQYTGLTDKNGTKIFEGDILVWNNEEVDDIDGLPFEDELSVVEFCEKRKGYIKRGIEINFEEDFVGFNKNHYRVIGNIHDNPELLKIGD